jgi:Mn2+/Fe2+ NRAMP family transporter
MVLGWMITSLFLLIITLIFFFILSEKSALMEHSFENGNGKEYFQGLMLVYAALLSVILFNKFVMGVVLHRICDFERHPTTDL